jgi:hypothetical protein
MGTAHDLVAKRLVAAVRSVNPRETAEVFVASLADRNLQERSAFGSLAFGKHFREHPFKADAGRQCDICGQYNPVRDRAIEELVEERACGGTHFASSLIYAAYDLECFASETKRQPSATDIATFNNILTTLAGLDDRDGAPQAAKALQRVLPADANERVKLLNVLGLSGAPKPRLYYRSHRSRAARGVGIA